VPDKTSVPPLVFVHVPKAGGTTLNNILMKNYRYRLDSYGNDFFPRYYPDEFVSLVQAPVDDDTRRPAFFTGHIDLANDIFRYMPVRYVAITMLREPVARFLSAYYFLQRRPLHPMHRKVKSERIGVEDFIRLTPQRQNLQCSLIAGIKSPGKCEESTLEIAKENLAKSFSIVGLSERFEESLMLIAKTFQWEIPFYENRKVAKTRPKVEANAVDMIKEHNRLDLELYEFGKGLFQAKLAEKQKEVNEGLAEFRALPKPSSVESIYRSTVGAGRFIMTKIASAV